MRFVHITLVLCIAFLFTSCSQEEQAKEVKQLDLKLLDSKIGKIENQKLITQVEQKELKKIKREKIIPVSVKKENFKKVLVPIVTEVYTQLDLQYKSVKQDIENNTNQEYIEKLKEYYNVKSNEELLMALKPHPISIALAQSAIESAWLTSRFTNVANNIFGVWSFRKNEPRVEANATRGEKKIYLKKYKNFKSAIFDYYKNLGKHRAYKAFRKAKMETDILMF